jgi:hypothetical protein
MFSLVQQVTYKKKLLRKLKEFNNIYGIL